jgi:eukaryotic-like serine/threonine-protein kinase
MSRLGDRFVLEREIGSGGMSAVFLGRDEVLDRPVAVKVLKPGFDDSEVVARFRQEGRTAAKLSHPNIVQVYDAGEDTLDGRNASYIVMEYVPGGDLRRLMDKKGPLPEAELSRIGAEVAAGLAHAHERGIVHRDVKPHNILLDERGLRACRPRLPRQGPWRPTGSHRPPRETPPTGASVTATITGFAGLRKIRERLGGPSAPEPSGIPTQTVVFPTRTFRPGPRPMALAVVAVTLLLLVLVAWGAYAMLSSDGERASPPTGPPEAARQENAGGPASKDGSPETSREQQPEHPGPLPPPNQAANAVYNMYVAAATNDFGASWGYLSERYQDEVGTLKDWQERYEPVSYVQFDRSPEVEIEDDEAEVHFEVHETRPEGTKTVGGHVGVRQ